MYIYIRLLIIFILLISFNDINASLPFDTLRLIDKINNNWLFRGPIPDYFDKFQYDALKFAMNLIVNEKLPQHFYMMDINLLNHPSHDDRKAEREEEAYFLKHLEHGNYTHWPTNGTKLSPYNYTINEIKHKIMNWTITKNPGWIDPLPIWMEYVGKILHNNNNKPIVMYFHCQGGKDRTGELSGAYYMRWLNMSLKDAIDLDTKIAGRNIGQGNVYAIQWYCFYLKYIMSNFSHLTCD